MDNIRNMESKFNVRFPKEYKNIITDEHILPNIEIKSVNVDTVIYDFLSSDYRAENNMYDVYLEYRELMLDGIVPIATTEYDDLICLYYKGGRRDEPLVIYWSFELALEEREEGVLDVASSFLEFLDKFVISS